MDLSLWQSWFHPQRATANSRPSAQTQTCCFSQGKKEHQNNAVRSALLGLFRIMIMQQSVNINYHGMSLVLLRWLWKVIMSRFLDLWFTVAKKERKRQKWGLERVTEIWKEKDVSLVITIRVCLSLFLTPQQWEKEKSLCWSGVRCRAWTAGVPCHPEQWKMVSVVDIQRS